MCARGKIVWRQQDLGGARTLPGWAAGGAFLGPASTHACALQARAAPPPSHPPPPQGTYLLLEKLRYAVYRRLLRKVAALHAVLQPDKRTQIPLGALQAALALQVRASEGVLRAMCAEVPLLWCESAGCAAKPPARCPHLAPIASPLLTPCPPLRTAHCTA